MNKPLNTGGRINPAPSNDPLRPVRVEQRRVVDSDINQLKANSRTMQNAAGKTNLRNISSSREFSRQMSKQSLNDRGRITPHGVKQVASRMYAAGYNKQSIYRAMRHHNGQFSRMSNAQFKNYFNRNVKPALRHPKVARARTQNDAFKRQHGIPSTYKNINGLQKMNGHVQKQHRTRTIARQQTQQKQIAQNRKQAVQSRTQVQQYSHSRGRR